MSSNDLQTPEGRNLWLCRIREHLAKNALVLRRVGRTLLCHMLGLLVGLLLARVGMPHWLAKVCGIIVVLASEEVLARTRDAVR